MYTIPSLEPNTIAVLHKIRKMRHVATYDSVEIISDDEADAAMETARELGTTVLTFFKAKYLKLLG